MKDSTWVFVCAAVCVALGIFCLVFLRGPLLGMAIGFPFLGGMVFGIGLNMRGEERESA